MEKNKIQKIWEAELKKVLKGNKEYAYFSISTEAPIRTILGKDIKPHTLIVFLQADEKIIIKGFYNGKAVELQKEDNKDAENIQIIVSEKDEEEIKLYVKVDEDIQLHSEKAENEKHHRVIIFQENRFFTEIINYDSRLNMIPSRIIFADKNESLLLKSLGLSMLCQNIKSLYSILQD